MKYILLLLIFLVACTFQPIGSTQNVLNLKSNDTEITSNSSINNSAINKTEVVALPFVEEVTPIVAKKIPMTLSSDDKDKVYVINKSIHRIEVIDVTEEQDGCLIKVDDTLVLINEGSDQRVNGVRIYVLDVRAFRNQLKDSDVCEVIIS